MTKKRKPINLHLAKGNPNRLTKEEIRKRQKHEERMTARTDKIEPPSRLTKIQKERFDELSTQLVELEIMDNLDVDTLAMYIEMYDNYVRVVRSARKMTNQDIDGDFKEYAAKMRTATQLSDQCRKLASDLGLTITSRLKLIIPETENKTESPMAEFLKRRGGND